MAKGLRSSVKKANKSRLRDRVFGPAEDARKERLSAKLLELAMRPAEKDHKKEGIAATKPGENYSCVFRVSEKLTCFG